MKFEVSGVKKTCFEDLNTGDTFTDVCGVYVYMKLSDEFKYYTVHRNEEEMEETTLGFNSVCLNNGCTYKWADKAEVARVDGVFDYHFC